MIRHALLFLLLILHEISAQNQCTTGTCINIKQCRSLTNTIKNQPMTEELYDYLRELQCGFEGFDPKVCCEQQTSVTATTSRVPDPPNVDNHRNLRLLNDDRCGPSFEDKISGGTRTGVFDFPWMALLPDNSGQTSCAGSLINKRYVLTAAHCIKSNLNRVRLREHDLSTESDCNSTMFCAEKYQDFGIESTYPHPKFSTRTAKNDIALIRLNRDVDFQSSHIRPICMPIGSAANLTKKIATVTGWGLTEENILSTVLLRVQLPLIDEDECNRRINLSNGWQIWYKQICAGGKAGVNTCVGDSGGPLQAPVKYKNDVKYVQYGIVSYGSEICNIGDISVYTKIAYYMDWILDTIRQ